MAIDEFPGGQLARSVESERDGSKRSERIRETARESQDIRERERGGGSERMGGEGRDSRYSYASCSALAFCVAFARPYLGLGHGADRVR